MRRNRGKHLGVIVTSYTGDFCVHFGISIVESIIGGDIEFGRFRANCVVEIFSQLTGGARRRFISVLLGRLFRTIRAARYSITRRVYGAAESRTLHHRALSPEKYTKRFVTENSRSRRIIENLAGHKVEVLS